MKKIFSMIMLLLFATGNVVAQNPNNHWQIGNTDINFSTNPPTTSTVGVASQYGNASVSDDNGNLLFYTDGFTVWNKNHAIIPQVGYSTSSNENGFDSFQNVVIVPQINTSKYYIFRVINDQYSNGTSTTPATEFHYYEHAIIDFTNNPLGSFQNFGTSDRLFSWKKLQIDTNGSNMAFGHSNPLTITKMNNNQGYWVITGFDQKIASFGLTELGLSTPIFSNVTDFQNNKKAIFKFTPSNTKFGLFVSNQTGMFTAGKFYIFDFDSSTGIFSNQTRINFDNYFNEISGHTFAFSNDSQKLYYVGASSIFVKEFLIQNTLEREVASLPRKTPQLNDAPYRWNLQTDKNGELLLLANELDYVKRVLNQNSYLSSSLSANYFTLNSNFPNVTDYNIKNLPQLIPTLIPLCPNTLVTSTNVTSGLDKKQAAVNIEATNIINSGAGAIYHAPTLLLKATFNAKAGSTVHIYSAGCTNTFLARPTQNTNINNNSEISKSVFEKSVNVIAISPNPSNGIFTISLNDISEGKIEISDLFGFIVYKSYFKDQTDFEMNMQDRPKGIYIVKVFSGEQVFTNKIIKN